MKYILILLILASCKTAQPFVYAPAKITVKGNQVHIQPLQKFKPMPDTVIEGTIIRRRTGAVAQGW